ncbi:Hsp20/alpha crystallin family protein [Verrucomicrobiota bacterium]
MTDKEVVKRDEDVERIQAPGMETTCVPDVDIREDDQCIRLLADMPGADRKSVNVTVENNVLTVEGQADVDAPKGYELVGQEYGVGKYRRDFTLSTAVDVEGIKARVRHGVVAVTIPKREEVKTRKVEIES